MHQKGTSQSGNILWIGWLIVIFGFGIWVGRFGISEQTWVRWTNHPISHLSQSRRLALHKHNKNTTLPPRAVPVSCRPCPHVVSATSQPVTMKDLPQLAWHQMPVGQRRVTLQLMNSLRLPCGCGQTLAHCIQTDLQRCPRLRGVVDSVMTAVHNGRTTQSIRRSALFSTKRSKPVSQPASTPVRERRLQARHVYFVPVFPGNPDYGSSHAKLTIVLFSDFVCPHCWAVMKVIKRLEEQYGQAEVRVVFRHYPLPQHPKAGLAAEASLAALAQGKFWLFHDKLFRNQGKFSRKELAQYAAQLKMDLKSFNKALDQHRYRGVVQRDKQLGQSLKLPGIPFVFINGMPVLGGKATMQKVAALAWKRAESLLKKGVKRWDLYSTLIKYGRREP